MSDLHLLESITGQEYSPISIFRGGRWLVAPCLQDEDSSVLESRQSLRPQQSRDTTGTYKILPNARPSTSPSLFFTAAICPCVESHCASQCSALLRTVQVAAKYDLKHKSTACCRENRKQSAPIPKHSKRNRA